MTRVLGAVGEDSDYAQCANMCLKCPGTVYRGGSGRCMWVKSVHGSHFGAEEETNRTGEERNCVQGAGTAGMKPVNMSWTVTDRQLCSRSKDATFSRQTPEPEY
jgi:hypothetical protein